MASTSQAVLHRRLLERYLTAVISGGDQVVLHVNEVADICDYLNSKDQTQGRIHKPFLDDSQPAVIETFIKLREKQLGKPFAEFDQLRSDKPDTNGAV